ncbi:MAG: hypothetical protein ABI905_09390 [Betaproteobacteria bacterium]
MKFRALLLIVAFLFSPFAAAQTPAEAAIAKRAAAMEKAAADKAEADRLAAEKAAAEKGAAAKAATAAPAAPPAVTYKEGVIKVGDTMKQTTGKVADLDKGDNGCYLTMKDDKGIEFIEIGKFEICAQKPPLKGKKVSLAYSVETIQAASCYGDPKCRKTEVVPLVISVKIVD